MEEIEQCRKYSAVAAAEYEYWKNLTAADEVLQAMQIAAMGAAANICAAIMLDKRPEDLYAKAAPGATGPAIQSLASARKRENGTQGQPALEVEVRESMEEAIYRAALEKIRELPRTYTNSRDAANEAVLIAAEALAAVSGGRTS